MKRKQLLSAAIILLCLSVFLFLMLRSTRRITLETAAATPKEANLLEMDQGTPVFIQEETVVSNETNIPIHWTKQIMRGDYFKFYLLGESSRLTMKKTNAGQKEYLQ